MDNIIIYPKNEKQKFLLKSLLEEMKVRFEVGKFSEKIALSENDFLDKIDKSLKQAASGQTKKLGKEDQKAFLGL